MSILTFSIYQYTTDDKFLNGVVVTCDNSFIGYNDTTNYGYNSLVVYVDELMTVSSDENLSPK